MSVGPRSYRNESVAVETSRLYLTSMNPALPEASSARRRLISTSARCDHNGRCLRASGPSRQALASSARSGPVHPCTTHERRFLDLSSRAFSSWRPPRTGVQELSQTSVRGRPRRSTPRPLPPSSLFHLTYRLPRQPNEDPNIEISSQTTSAMKHHMFHVVRLLQSAGVRW